MVKHLKKKYLFYNLIVIIGKRGFEPESLENINKYQLVDYNALSKT